MTVVEIIYIIFIHYCGMFLNETIENLKEKSKV